MPDDYYPAPGYIPPIVTYDQERGICLAYPPGGTPARDPEPPALPASRFVQRGGYMICTVCDMAVQYCKCPAPATTTPPPISDLLGRANAKGRP